MTTYESEEDIRRTLKAGAKGYLAKGTDPRASGGSTGISGSHGRFGLNVGPGFRCGFRYQFQLSRFRRKF